MMDPKDLPRPVHYEGAYGPPAEEPPDDQIDKSPCISIVYYQSEAAWKAIWQGDSVPDHIMTFTGSRTEAIEWARSRCDTIQIETEGTRDLRPLLPRD
jgi:hypothetical protein